MNRLRSLLLVVVLVAGVLAATLVPVAWAQEAEPSDELLGIISPTAAPVCAGAGLATVLVPLVGGIAAGAEVEGIDTVGDLLLNSTGPVFIVCSELPAPDGTNCEVIDGQIAGVWPERIERALTPPPVGGNLVESASNAAEVLGLGPLDLLDEPLRCTIPPADDSFVAPPPPRSGTLGDIATPELPAAPDQADSPAVSPPSPTGGTTSVADPVPTSARDLAAAVESTRSLTVINVAFRTVGDLVRLLQILVALALAAFLARAWTMTWLVNRRD